MKCDYCDSKFKEMPEDQVCPNCGAIVPTIEERKMMLRFPNPPVGKYIGHNGSVQIERDRLIIRRAHFLEMTHEIEIRYCDLVSVDLLPAEKYGSGFLCVRDDKLRQYPVPCSSLDALTDVTCIVFYSPANEIFKEIADYLQACVRLAKDLNAVNTEEKTISGRFYGEDGYIELESEKVTICKKIGRNEQYVQVIPYEKIAEVAYKKGGSYSFGGLAIRAQGEHRDLNFAVRYPTSSSGTISIRQFHNDIFFKIYEQLQKIIQSAG